MLQCQCRKPLHFSTQRCSIHHLRWVCGLRISDTKSTVSRHPWTIQCRRPSWKASLCCLRVKRVNKESEGRRRTNETPALSVTGSVTFEPDSPATSKVVPADWIATRQRHGVFLLHVSAVAVLVLQETASGRGLLPLLPLCINMLHRGRLDRVGQHSPVLMREILKVKKKKTTFFLNV